VAVFFSTAMDSGRTLDREEGWGEVSIFIGDFGKNSKAVAVSACRRFSVSTEVIISDFVNARAAL
jgi:hypothetical protein